MTSFVLTVMMVGQERFHHRTQDRIIELRKNFIAEGLELSKEEESKFWPIYDNFHREMDALKKSKSRPRRDLSDISDEEAEVILAQDLKSRASEMQLQMKYYGDIQAIIPAKQVLILNERERLFHKKVFDRVRKRMQNRRGG